MTAKRSCTLDDIECLLEELSDNDEIKIDDVEVAVNPPELDPQADDDDVYENDIESADAQNVACSLELIKKNEGDTEGQQVQTIHPYLTMEEPQCKKIKGTMKQKAKSLGKSFAVEPCWSKGQPHYRKIISKPAKDKFEGVVEALAGHTVAQVFQHFLSDEVLQYIVEQTILYARQKKNSNFKLDINELRVFIAILIFSGYHKLPKEDLYWECTPDVGVPLVYNAMTRTRFREIKKYLHLNDNDNVDKGDKMFKLRPYFEMMNENYQKFGLIHGHLSIDEMIVRCHGLYPEKMCMKGKSLKFGYKMWCLCSSDGYLYKFIPYCGKLEGEEGQLRTDVVDALTEVIPSANVSDYELFFNNFHIFDDVLVNLQSQNIKATGAVQEKKRNEFPLIESEKMEKEKERGYFDHCFDKNNEIFMVKWKDNKCVTVATNYSYLSPFEVFTRYSQNEHKNVSVQVPRLVAEYYSYRSGVAVMEKQVSLYRIKIWSKKWWWPLFTQILDMTAVNCWLMYRLANPKEDITLLDVKRKIVLAYLSKKLISTPKRTGPQRTKTPRGRVSDEIRFDEGNHLISPIPTQRRCAECGKKTKRLCIRCDVPLHDRCFVLYHRK